MDNPIFREATNGAIAIEDSLTADINKEMPITLDIGDLNKDQEQKLYKMLEGGRARSIMQGRI